MKTSELKIDVTTTKPLYYASFHPRGFSNEYEVRAFATKALRDRFVSAVPRSTYSEHYRAWVQNESNARAYAITAAEAAAKTNRKGWVGGYAHHVTLRQHFGADETPKGFSADDYDAPYSVVTDLDSDGYEPQTAWDEDAA